MENAISYLIEPLLTQFFLIDAVCRGFIDELVRKEIFEELAKIFCVPMNNKTEKYFELANSALYKNITDYSAYERLCRSIEFAENSGQDVELTYMDRVILAGKRESMTIKEEIFKQNKNLTSEIIMDTLLNMAMNGNVDAMAMLAYIEYNGIGISEDRTSAVKRLSLCAKWNSLFGNLMGIAYDDINKSQYYDRLYTISRSTNQKEIFKYICDFNSYEKECSKSAVAKIIEKAFSLGIIKKNMYDRIFAKVAFSDLVSLEDKEKLLLSKKQDAIVSLSDIPFDVDRKSLFVFDASKANGISLKRDKELHKVLCSLYPVTQNRNDLYQTLLVAGDDEYIAQMYLDAIKAGFSNDNKVFEVDAGNFSEQDFAGSKENFILRGLSETKQSHTVFLVKNCEEIGEYELEELLKLLDYEYRRKFKLLEPTVSVDLSDVLIVLFASSINEKVCKLSKECDVVWIEKISNSEKCTVIESTFKSRSKTFGISCAELKDDGKKYLEPFETGQIIRIIDGALKKAAFDNESVITAESLKSITAQQNVKRNKREFGYLGGVLDEEY